jgi:hypothetical protein
VSRLPNFDAPQLPELRDFWKRYPDPDARRLILEIHYQRLFLRYAYRILNMIDECWQDALGDRLLDIVHLKACFEDERQRFGKITETRFSEAERAVQLASQREEFSWMAKRADKYL